MGGVLLPEVSLVSWTTSERVDRLRADACFALAEQTSAEAGPAHLVLVPCGCQWGLCVGARGGSARCVRGWPTAEAAEAAIFA
jgi:hypothetical protein